MTMRQHNPPHVGGLIYRTYIEPFDDVSANKLADALGVERSTFNRLLNGISDLSPEMAIRLSTVLGGSAESWLRIQENYKNDFNLINKDTDLGHTFSLGKSGDGMRTSKLWDEMKKQNSKVNFSNELGELLVFISKIATAIRMNTPYNSKYKNLTNRDIDVLNFSELLSEFNSLGASLAGGDVNEVRKSCDILLSFRLSKNSSNPTIKSLMDTFERWGKGSEFNIVSQDEGIKILERIRDKAHAPDSH